MAKENLGSITKWYIENVLNKTADPLTDYEVSRVGNDSAITQWDESKLGTKPTETDIMSYEQQWKDSLYIRKRREEILNRWPPSAQFEAITEKLIYNNNDKLTQLKSDIDEVKSLYPKP